MEKILRLPAKREEWQKVSVFLEQQLNEVGCTEKKKIQILIAAEEVFVNIASYAYKQDGGMTEIKVGVTPDRQLKIAFLDWGIPYNPLERENPDITLSAEARDTGGLGILMVRKMMDNLLYRYEDGQNCLILLKNI